MENSAETANLVRRRVRELEQRRERVLEMGGAQRIEQQQARGKLKNQSVTPV